MRLYRVVLGVLVSSMLMAGVLNIGGSRDTKVLDKSSTRLVVSMGMDKLQYETFELGGRKFTRFYLKDRDIGEITDVGKPNLPVIRRFFEVPEGADVSFKVVSYDKDEISLKDAGIEHPIMPSYPPVPKIKGAEPRLVIDEALYKSNDFWPRDVINVKKAGNVRGHNLYVIEYYPLRYNPVSEKLEVIKNITVEIEYKGGNAAYTMSAIQRKYSPFFERMLQKRVINYGEFESKLNPSLPITYLIITPAQYLDSLQAFITWKKQMGYYVHVATIPDSIPAGDTLTVKQYIQNAYDNWTNPPTFVLLVGDVDAIGYWQSQDDDNPANDLGYALVEGNDYFPDIYVGRFSATTDSMVGVIVRKVVTYEKTLWGSDTLWPQRAYFMASDDGSHHDIAEGTSLYCMDIVRNHQMIADSLFEYYHSGTPVAEAINDGRSLATYTGHGSEDGWGGPSFSISDVYSLSNDIRTPFIQSYACLTGRYTVDECYMEAWLRAPDKGAAAAMGSSVTSLWDEDDILQRRMFDEIFDTGYVWVMGAINAAKMDFYAHYGDSTGYVPTYRYFQMYNLFGDPSMYFYTNVPYQFNVSHAPTMPFGTVNFDVTVSDANGSVEGALVSAVQNGNLLDAKYTDATGMATLTITVTTPDTVYITVTGYNHKPHESFVIPSGAGAYVSVLATEILDTAGNSNNRINPGETITLNTLLKNWGQDSAYNVVATLNSSNPLVTISQNYSTFGDLGSEDSVWNNTSYVFSVSNNATDGDVLQFELEAVYQDTGATDTTVSRLSFTVYAPLIKAGMPIVVDTFSQDNGDYVAQPGEVIDLLFSAKNMGHEDISNVTATLSTSDPYITINTGSVSYGDIPVDSTVSLQTPFNVGIDSGCPDPHEAELYVTFTGDGYTFYDTIKLFIGNTGYYTDVEDTTQTDEWTMNNPWHVSTRRFYSENHSFYFGDESTGEYPSNADASLISPYIKVGPDAKLVFWTWYDLESRYDYGYVEYSADSGNTWVQLASYTGTSDWKRVVIDLSGVSAGTDVLIRFRGTSDDSYQREGWYIDDIRVTPPEAPTTLIVKEYNIDDASGNGNGFADPGETVLLKVVLQNVGNIASGTSARLVSGSWMISVIDSIYTYGDIEPDSSREGTFQIAVSSSAEIGAAADLVLIVSANSGAYTDTIDLSLVIGDKTLKYTGPDSYGYYIYDMFDGYSEHPEYEWIEIDTVGTIVANGDDTTEVVNLPFTFKYYGIDYDQISICSNGWIGFGAISSHAYSNTSMPSSSEPNNIVAPLWDDMNPTYSGSGKIYYYYDSTFHRVIVEWDGVSHFYSSDKETFEVVLYDPAYNPTITGDGEILIQYKTAPSQDDFTIGMENSDGTIGLTYCYDNAYNEYASYVRAEFAIKITTDTPVYVGIEENPVTLGPATYKLIGNFPNPFRGHTVIRFAIPKESNVNLSIYDISGRKVATLMSGKVKRGYYSVIWNGRDERGRKVKSGIYFYVLKANKFRKSRKMIMVR